MTLREPITRGAQKIADLIEGIALAPAVTGRVLLDAAAYLIKGIAGELDDMEGIEDAGCVLELVVDGVLVSLEGIQRRDLDTGAKLFAALGQPVLMHGARPAWDQVHSSGPWGGPPLEWSTMPVSSRGPGGVGPGDATRLSSTPSTRTPAKRARSSDAARRHGLIWDHTVFHVVASCRARSAMVTPSKRNCRITQRITRTPKRARGAHTRSSYSRNVTVGQVRSRHIQHRIVPPEPCQDPGPGRVDHLHHHTPVALSNSPRNPGSPPAGCTTQHRVPEYLGCEPRSSDGSPPNRRADHTDHNDQATHSSSR